MDRRWLLLLLLSSVACSSRAHLEDAESAALTLPLRAEATSGCYTLAVRWSEAARQQWRGNVSQHEPRRLQLSLDGRSFDAPAEVTPVYKVKAVPGDTLPTDFDFSYWGIHRNGGLQIVWSTGFTGIVMSLRPNATGYTGLGSFSDDDGTEIPRAAGIAARRVPCATAAEPGAAADVRQSRGVDAVPSRPRAAEL